MSQVAKSLRHLSVFYCKKNSLIKVQTSLAVFDSRLLLLRLFRDRVHKHINYISDHLSAYFSRCTIRCDVFIYELVKLRCAVVGLTNEVSRSNIINYGTYLTGQNPARWII